MTSTIEIFCCYARKDQPLLQSLKTHLMPLQWQGLITIRSDTDINAGVEWEEEIKKHLNTAQMILLLISPDFMASKYCYRKEMQRAIQRHEQQEAYVIPILLRPTYWKGTPFARLQMLPTNAKAVTDRNWHSEDEALYDIVEHISTVVKTLRIRHYLQEASSSPRISRCLCSARQRGSAACAWTLHRKPVSPRHRPPDRPDRSRCLVLSEQGPGPSSSSTLY